MTTESRPRHVCALTNDTTDRERAVWRCLCGWTRNVNGDRTAAELEVERHVQGVTT